VWWTWRARRPAGRGRSDGAHRTGGPPLPASASLVRCSEASPLRLVSLFHPAESSERKRMSERICKMRSHTTHFIGLRFPPRCILWFRLSGWQLTWAPEKLARRLIGGSFTSPRAVTAPCAHPNGTTSATLTALIVHIATELMRYNNGPQ
jgi:hypothetical protein